MLAIGFLPIILGGMLDSKILRAEKAELEAAIAQLEPMKKRLNLIVELLKLYPDTSNVKTHQSQPELLPDARFSGMGVTEAIIAFLGEQGLNWSTPAEIVKGILAGGFRTQSDNLSQIVYAACKRKAEGEDAPFEVTQESGAREYRLKNLSTAA